MRVDKGMMPVPRTLAERIKRGDFVDFADLPPARPDEGWSRKHYNPRVVIWRELDFSRVARKVPEGNAPEEVSGILGGKMGHTAVGKHIKGEDK